MRGLIQYYLFFVFFTYGLFFCINGHSLTCQNLFTKIPERSYHNSQFEFLNALKTIGAEYSFKKIDLGDELYRVNGKTISYNSKLPETFKPELFAIHHSVKIASKYMGLSIKSQDYLAAVILRDAVRAINLSWSGARNHIERITTLKDSQYKKHLLGALEGILQLTEVDFNHEITYLAGYSSSNPSKIYIDSGFNREATFLYSKVNLVPFLVVHERVEKALLDTLSIDHDRYLISHQIAQRIEKAMVEAANINWDVYQNKVMQEEIKRAGAQDRYYSKTPYDLDLTPYLDAKDKDALQKLRHHAVTPKPSSAFQLNILRPGVIHLQFKNQEQMAWTMMRFQEFYESPRFRGKVFSRKQFLNWFAQKKNGYKSYSEWDGFNVPNEILNIFYEGQFNPLTKNEITLLDALKNFRHAKFYIIATAGRESPVLDHEIAHSLFYFNLKYKTEVLNILENINTLSLRYFLREKIGDYHDAVLLDEVHAWLTHDSAYLTELGFDIKPYKETIIKLQNLYKEFTASP